MTRRSLISPTRTRFFGLLPAGDDVVLDFDTSIADYVWLPFRFDGEMAYLDWRDEWRIEDFA